MAIPTININLNLPFLRIPAAILSILGQIFGFVNGIINTFRNIFGILKSIKDKFIEAFKNIFENIIPDLIAAIKAQIKNLRNLQIRLNLSFDKKDILRVLRMKVQDFIDEFGFSSVRELFEKLGLDDFAQIINGVLNIDRLLESTINDFLSRLESFTNISIGGIGSVSFECFTQRISLGSGYKKDFLSETGFESPFLKLPEFRTQVNHEANCARRDKSEESERQRRQEIYNQTNRYLDLSSDTSNLAVDTTIAAIDTSVRLYPERYKNTLNQIRKDLEEFDPTLRRVYYRLDNKNVIIEQDTPSIPETTIEEFENEETRESIELEHGGDIQPTLKQTIKSKNSDDEISFDDDC